MSTIEIKSITKTYGKKTALDNVSLTLRENCIYGLLGRNGAGKSTLLNIISGRAYADSGEILIDGESNIENDRALSKLHMMSEHLLSNPGLKVRDMLKISSWYYPEYDMKYALQLCEEYELDIKSRLDKLSTGYRTIAKFINALATNAPVIFFDEPVLGLDANHREMFYRHVINRFTERPATYVISTHLIEEAAGLIERAVVVKDGKILLDEETENIRTMGCSVSGKAADVDAFIAGREVMNTENAGNFKTAYIMGQLDREDVPENLDISPLSLQSMFIHLTNT